MGHRKEMAYFDVRHIEKALEIYGYRPTTQRGSHVTFDNGKGGKTNTVLLHGKTSLAGVSMAGKDLEEAGTCSRQDFIRLVKGLAGKLPPGKEEDI